jgi:hypothetical protein
VGAEALPRDGCPRSSRKTEPTTFETLTNELAIDGSLDQTIQSILEEIYPEAAYFADMEGARGGYLVINMDDASQIPAIAEPLFIGLDATVQIHP